MSDLLIRLYDLPRFEAEDRVKATGVVVRRAIAPERDVILDWFTAEDDFPRLWRGEIALGLSQMPATTLIATRGQELLGFACYDTSAKGFFGPTGVTVPARGQGIGEALLIVTLKAMREAGYAYAVIGDPGPVEFYRRRLDVLEIPQSEPGHYTGMLRRK